MLDRVVPETDVLRVTTGRGGRALRLALASPLVAVLPIALLVNIETPAAGVLTWFAVAVLLGLFWLWMRLPLTGARADGDRLIVRSWWSTRSFARETIARFREEDYFGALDLAGLPWLATSRIAVELHTGESVSLGGTFSGGRAVRDAVSELNTWVGIEVGPRRAGRLQGSAEDEIERRDDGRRAARNEEAPS